MQQTPRPPGLVQIGTTMALVCATSSLATLLRGSCWGPGLDCLDVRRLALSRAANESVDQVPNVVEYFFLIRSTKPAEDSWNVDTYPDDSRSYRTLQWLDRERWA